MNHKKGRRPEASGVKKAPKKMSMTDLRKAIKEAHKRIVGEVVYRKDFYSSKKEEP